MMNAQEARDADIAKQTAALKASLDLDATTRRELESMRPLAQLCYLSIMNALQRGAAH